VLWTAGSAESQQAVIAGSVDIGLFGTASAMGAFAKGAPLRVIGALATGTKDYYYYVLPGSSLRTLKDATERTTVAFSSTGSLTYLLAQGLIKLYGVNAKPTRTGDPQATLTQVMSGQVDVGYAGAPFALQYVDDGKIRIIARADELVETRDQTGRAIVANAGKLARDKELIARFIRAYADTVDWMYTDPMALQYYEAYSGILISVARKGISQFFDKKRLDPYRVSGLKAEMADAIKLKLLSAPLTEQQLAEFVQVPPRS
jgi:NitT/TauT family transport system substrate-binding protein